MINKKNIWFLTLFSLILVLSVYYITMPTELLINTNKQVEPTNTNVEEKTESAALVALRVEKEDAVLKELSGLKDILTNKESTVEQKNDAYEKMKNINVIKGEEEQLEKTIKDQYQLDAVVTVKGDKISVTVAGKDHSTELANKIMRTIQGNYTSKMYVSVKFEQ